MSNNHNRINVVHTDSSSVFDKKQQLITSGYFNRTRWERATIVDVLRDDKLYLKLIGCDKQYCDFVRGASVFGHTIESTIYTDLDYNKLLFAIVAHRNEVTSDLTANQQIINSTKQNENFVFASVFPNISTTKETGRGGNEITMLEGVQLFRYDPTGRFKHHNSEDIYDYYKNSYGQKIADFYKSYFTEEVEFPHFHFSNRTMAETYGKTAEANAISLDNLISYVEKLMYTNDVSNIINNFDFGMPYLEIKKNPNNYKTAIDIRNLREALINNNVNKQINEIFKQTQKLQPTIKVLTGLDAVYADLVLLRILRGSAPAAATLSQLGPNNDGTSGSSGQQSPSGGTPSGRMIGGVSSGGGNAKSLKDSHSLIRRMLDERQPRSSEEQPKYEVSTAELQLASKIASADNMVLKNSKGRERMHFEEADSYVDEVSINMLYQLLDFCEKQNCKGDDHGPIL